MLEWQRHPCPLRRPKTFLHGQGVAVGIAIFNSVAAIGGFAGPYVVGSLVDQGGYDKCMYVLGALFAVMGGLILRAPPHPSRMLETPGKLSWVLIACLCHARHPSPAVSCGLSCDMGHGGGAAPFVLLRSRQVCWLLWRLQFTALLCCFDAWRR